jgi:hypothetical protein
MRGQNLRPGQYGTWALFCQTYFEMRRAKDIHPQLASSSRDAYRRLLQPTAACTENRNASDTLNRITTVLSCQTVDHMPKGLHMVRISAGLALKPLQSRCAIAPQLCGTLPWEPDRRSAL